MAATSPSFPASIAPCIYLKHIRVDEAVAQVEITTKRCNANDDAKNASVIFLTGNCFSADADTRPLRQA